MLSVDKNRQFGFMMTKMQLIIFFAFMLLGTSTDLNLSIYPIKKIVIQFCKLFAISLDCIIYSTII